MSPKFPADNSDPSSRARRTPRHSRSRKNSSERLNSNQAELFKRLYTALLTLRTHAAERGMPSAMLSEHRAIAFLVGTCKTQTELVNLRQATTNLEDEMELIDSQDLQADKTEAYRELLRKNLVELTGRVDQAYRDRINHRFAKDPKQHNLLTKLWNGLQRSRKLIMGTGELPALGGILATEVPDWYFNLLTREELDALAKTHPELRSRIPVEGDSG